MISSAPPQASAPDRSTYGRYTKSINSFIDRAPPRLRTPKSLPPWIDSYEARYGSIAPEQLLLLNPPNRAAKPQSNATPYEPQRRVSKDGFISWDDPVLGPAHPGRSRIPHILRHGRGSRRGRKWDHLRSAEPVIVSGYKHGARQRSVAWRDFVQSSSWGRSQNEHSEIIDQEILNKLQPTFNDDVAMSLDFSRPSASRRRRTLALYKRVWNLAVRHSLSPLVFRLSVIVTSIFALAIAARIFRLEDKAGTINAEKTQSAVVVAVDCVAIPYSAYMIWDEYTGKPIGLRSAVSKVSLILLDLFFIIFKSASTALAFESLVYHVVSNETVLELAKVLAAFMLIGLISWSMNLTVNVFRTVERLGGGDDDDMA